MLTARMGWGCAVMTAVLCAFAVPGIVDSRVMGFLALAPLYAALKQRRTVLAFFMGWFSGALAICIATPWVISSSATIFGYTTPAGVGILLLISLYQGLQFALAAIVHSFSQRVIRPWLSFALCFGAADALFPHLFPASHSLFLYNAPIWLQTADIAGHGTVTFLVALANASLVEVIVGRKLFPVVIPGVMSMVFMLGYAWVRVMQIDDVVKKSPIARVAVIQTGTFPREAQQDNARLLQTHVQMSRAAGNTEPIDLFIWSESLFNNAIRKDELSYELGELLHDMTAPVIMGVPIYVDSHSQISQHFNSVILAATDGWVCPKCRYDKNVLFPVGEQFVSAQNAGNESMAVAAHKKSLLEYKGHRIAAFVCFEGLLANYVRSLAQDAELLVNPSYDGWFGKTSAPAIHEALSRVRAIENRKPLIRAAMSGISTIVDPSGRVVKSADVGGKTAIVGNVAFMKMRTLYSMVGNIPWICILVMLVSLAVYSIIHKRRATVSEVA